MLSTRWGLALAAALLAIAPPSAGFGAEADGRLVRMDEHSAIVLSRDSPVQFVRKGPDGDAHFSGRFVLTGEFRFGCNFDCEEPIRTDGLTLVVRPDAALARRLPHWDRYRTGIEITITNPGAFMRSKITPRQTAALLSGKLDHVSGRASIEVDDLTLTIECDSPFYTARFVGFAKPQRLAEAQRASDYGCL